MCTAHERLTLKLYTMVLLILPALVVSTPITNDHVARTIYSNNTPTNSSGYYSYEFQTTNGITTKAAGNEFGSVGVVQYVSLEGIPITLTYMADADGYHPVGDHLPPVPPHVPKLLEYLRTHPAVDEKKSRRL